MCLPVCAWQCATCAGSAQCEMSFLAASHCFLPRAAANRPVEPGTGLSYRDTDQSAAGPNFHPLIQQKRLVTGQRKGDKPQVVRPGQLGLEVGTSNCCTPAVHHASLPAFVCVGVAFLICTICLAHHHQPCLHESLHLALLSKTADPLCHKNLSLPRCCYLFAHRLSSTVGCHSRPSRLASSTPPASTRASCL